MTKTKSSRLNGQGEKVKVVHKNTRHGEVV